MRKLKLFFACLLMAVLSIGQVYGAVYFEDTFSNVGTGSSGNILPRTGWSGSGTTAPQANTGVRVGASSSGATLTKSAMSNIEGTKNLKVTIYVAKYNKDASTLTVTATNGAISDKTGVGTLSAGTLTISPAANAGVTSTTAAATWADAFKTEFIITGASASTTISFASNKRLILGPVTIEDAPAITVPNIGANPGAAVFGTKNIYYAENKSGSLDIAVFGSNLTGNITAALSGDDASKFSISGAPVAPVAGEASGTLTVSYSIAEEGEYSASLTLSSDGATSVVIPISLSAISVAPTVYDKVMSDSELEEGDKIIIVNETYKKAAGAISGTLLSVVDITDVLDATLGKLTITNEAVQVFTLGGEEGAWTLTSDAGQLSSTEAKKMVADGATTWAITISYGNAAPYVSSSVGTLQYNDNSGNGRFTTYATSQQPVQFYKISNGKASAGLAYADAQKLVKVGTSFTAPTLTNPNNLTVSYASSDDNVVKVNASTGAITEIVAAGKAVITASFAGNDDYKAGEASYTIFVAEQAGTAGDPLTVASAKTLIDNGCTLSAHVAGVASAPQSSNFTIALTGGFQFYKANDLGNVAFENAYVGAGDQVTAYGQLDLYNSTYQLKAGCYLTNYEQYTAPKQSIENDKEHPYTIAQALEFGADPVTYETSEAIYVKGVVYDFGYYGSTSNIYIRDIDKTVADGKLELFKCAGLKEGDADPVAFENDAVAQLDTIIGYGVLKYYSGNAIWEFDGGENACYVVEHKAYVEPTYTISFDANTTAAYTGNLPTGATVTKDDVFAIPAACLERTDNYYQAGWNTDKNATDKMAATQLSNVQEDVVLYAIWKEITDCQITFYNIDTENAYDTKVKTQGVEYTFDDITAPTAPTGYTFAGWSTDQIPTEQENITPLTKVTPSSASMILYAVYTRSEGETTISYQKVTSAPDDWSGNYLIVNEEAGVAFDGSLETLDATDDVIDVTINAGVIAGSDAVDAAIFTVAASGSNYTLRSASGKYIGVSSNSNGLKQSDEADAYINSFGLDANNNAVISAVFDGSTMSLRYNKASNQNRFRYYKNAGQEVIQLYAQVIVLPTTYYTTKPATIYTISFSLAEDESGNFEPINVVKGENAQLPTATPTKVHNTFNKWSDGENEYAAGAQIENVQGNIILHATWNPATYATVSFDPNGPEVTILPIENVYEGEEYQLPAAPAYDDAHVFTGWKLGDDVFEADQVITMTSPAAAVEYVAQWADKTVTDVVILASYDDKWFALTNEVTTNKQVDAMQVDYYEGKVLNLSAENQAKITWERTIIGDQVTFKNGNNYIVGTTGTELYLNETAFQWKLVEGEYLAKASNQEYKRTFIYSGGVDAFKNYDKGNAGNEGYSAMPLVVEAAFGEGVAYTVVRENLEENRYYTVCLEKEIAEIKGASIWNLSKRGASLAYLEEASLPITAGTPFIIQATADKFEVIYDGDATPLPGNNGVLVGTFTKLTASNLNALTDAGKTIYMLVSNELRPIGNNNYLDAHRAYIDYDAFEVVNTTPNNAPGKRVRAIPMHKDVVTGFENLNATDKPVKMLIDGNIYILRGEKMYDATGRLVK
jgi:uncharacterized repeat protein (TIGR02543 family)